MSLAHHEFLDIGSAAALLTSASVLWFVAATHVRRKFKVAGEYEDQRRT